MKQYISTFLIAVTVAGASLNSCVELNPVDYSEVTPSNFPKTEEDLRALVLSCYNPLRGNWSNGIHSTSERGVMFINDATTEILTGTWGEAQICSELNFFPKRRKSPVFIISKKIRKTGRQTPRRICQQNQSLYDRIGSDREERIVR